MESMLIELNAPILERSDPRLIEFYFENYWLILRKMVGQLI